MKKGVSPLIAMVILVAFLIALMVIANTWLRGFTEERISEAEENKLKLACSKEVKIEITNLVNEKITIDNRGMDLAGFNFIIDGKTSYDDSMPLKETQVKTYNLNEIPYENVKVIPLLKSDKGIIKCGSQALTWNVKLPSQELKP